MFQGSVRDWQQMYDFLTWAYICSTYGEHSYSEEEEEEIREEEEEPEPQMVANYVMLEVKVRTKELITAREMKRSPERQRESLHTILYRSFVLWKSQGSGIIGNSLKRSRVLLIVLYEHKGWLFCHFDRNRVRCWKPISPVWESLSFQFWHFRISWLHFHENVLFSLLLFQLRLQRLKTVRKNSEAVQSEERLLTEARHGPE